jgi:hypothetical protein
MRRINRAALLGLGLLLFMPGLSAAQGWSWLWGDSEPTEVRDRWRTGDRLYGTVSATQYPVWNAVKPIGRDNWRYFQPSRVVQTTDQWTPPW